MVSQMSTSTSTITKNFQLLLELVAADSGSIFLLQNHLIEPVSSYFSFAMIVFTLSYVLRALRLSLPIPLENLFLDCEGMSDALTSRILFYFSIINSVVDCLFALVSCRLSTSSVRQRDGEKSNAEKVSEFCSF